MKERCPWCSKIHDSEEHDVGWYFVCCGHTRLVWEINTDPNEGPVGQLMLWPVQEDMNND